MIHSSGKKLRHQEVAVTVHHQTGKKIAFSVHEAVGVAGRSEMSFPKGRCLRETTVEKKLLDLLFLPGQYADSYLRSGIVQAARKPLATIVQHFGNTGFLRVIFHSLDGAGENPRVPVQDGFFSAFFEKYLLHGKLLEGTPCPFAFVSRRREFRSGTPPPPTTEKGAGFFFISR